MPYADLVVDSVQAGNACGINGQPLQVTWSVSNIGLGITNSSEWHDRVYLTSDPSGQTGLREIDSFSHAGAGIGRRLYSPPPKSCCRRTSRERSMSWSARVDPLNSFIAPINSPADKQLLGMFTRSIGLEAGKTYTRREAIQLPGEQNIFRLFVQTDALNRIQ